VERTVEVAQEILESAPDFSEVLESVQGATSEATAATQGAIQETAAAVGVTAAAKSFLGLSGPVRAMILLNLGSALFGSNQVAMKLTETQLDPTSISAIRFSIAAIFFLPGIFRGLKVAPLTLAGAELGMWLFGGYILQALGLETTTAAHGSFTGTIMVLIVPVLVGLSGRKVANSTWIGAIVALFGVALLTTSDSTPNYGDGLCVLSALLFGIHKWRSETATSRFRENTQELVAMQLGTLALAANVCELPKYLALSHNSPEQLMTMAAGLPWGLLVYMGAATTAFTLWVEINALKDVSAPLAALIYCSEPIWGALFAWTILGEHWGSTGWVGAFLIVAASLGAQLNTGDEVPEEEKPAVEVEVYDTES
jgi:drug/metabolite transporter (DMT)-like permease